MGIYWSIACSSRLSIVRGRYVVGTLPFLVFITFRCVRDNQQKFTKMVS